MECGKGQAGRAKCKRANRRRRKVTGHKRVRRETIKERLGMGRGNSGGNRVCNAGQERRGIEFVNEKREKGKNRF